MKKVKRVFSLIVYFKYVLRFVFLIFKTILKELNILLPVEGFEYKNADNNRLNRFKVCAVICYAFLGLFWAGYFFSASKHRILTLDILFFFYLLIPFLFKTYSKYLPSVNE